MMFSYYELEQLRTLNICAAWWQNISRHIFLDFGIMVFPVPRKREVQVSLRINDCGNLTMQMYEKVAHKTRITSYAKRAENNKYCLVSQCQMLRMSINYS
jgi:hypothetical protein